MKGAIDAATDYNSSILKLSKVMGETTAQASVLSTAIKMIGGTTDEYISMNMKLDRQVKTNGATLEQLA